MVSDGQPHACFVLSTLPEFPHFYSRKAVNPGIASSALQKWLLTCRLWEAAVVYCRVRLSLLGAIVFQNLRLLPDFRTGKQGWEGVSPWAS